MQGINRIKAQFTDAQMTQAEDLVRRLEREIEKNAKDISATLGVPELYPQK
jgi:hypothetical protein